MPRFFFSNKAIGGLLATTALAIMAIGYASSLWFLRGIWGPLPAETEFGYSNSHEMANFFAGQGKYIETLATATIGFNQQDVRRIAYIKDESGEYMALIPRFTRQFTTKAALRVSGWNVSRLGWILLANRINKASPTQTREYSLWNAVTAEAKAVAYNKLPVSPLFFFRNRQKDASPVAVYASHEKGKLHGSASIDGFEYSMPKRKTETKYKFNGKNNLIVALPSSVVDNLGKEFINAVNTSIAEGLHFQKTNPAILSSLPLGENIYLVQGANSVALGVRMQGEVFGSAIIDFMNKEQGQRHPKKKGFKLPDGSMGYEYVRGATNVGFAPHTNMANCLPSQQYDENLLLCGKQNAAVIASSQELGTQLLEFMMDTPKGEWRGYVSGEYPIHFSGSDKVVDVWVEGI